MERALWDWIVHPDESGVAAKHPPATRDEAAPGVRTDGRPAAPVNPGTRVDG